MKTRPDKGWMALGLVCLFGVSAANGGQKLDASRESLRGVQVISVDISSSKGATEAGLTEEQAKPVEKRIEEAGIKVMPRQLLAKVPGRCRLKITVDAYKPSGLETFILNVRLCFVQTAALERSPQTIVEATTWELTSLAHSSKDSVPDTVRKNLETMVDSFISDYRAVNPQAGSPPAAGAGSGDSAAAAGVSSASDSHSQTPEQKYVASTSGTVFHRPDCRWAQNISPANLVTYASKDEAIKGGKKPCKSCKP